MQGQQKQGQQQQKQQGQQGQQQRQYGQMTAANKRAHYAKSGKQVNMFYQNSSGEIKKKTIQKSNTSYYNNGFQGGKRKGTRKNHKQRGGDCGCMKWGGGGLAFLSRKNRKH